MDVEDDLISRLLVEVSAMYLAVMREEIIVAVARADNKGPTLSKENVKKLS